MKSISKSLLILLLASVSVFASAQYISLEEGYINQVRTGSQVSKTYMNGIRIGPKIEFTFKNNMSLLSGVLYNIVYADKLQSYPNSASATYITWGHSLDIPVHLGYSLDVPFIKNFRVFGFAGPNLNIGLSANERVFSTLSTISNSNTNLYKDDILKRLNLQVGVGGGMQWRNYQLKSGYDWGVLDLSKTISTTYYQRGWYLTFGYQF